MTLGAIMIVRNEEANLGAILSDITDVVDEICVVDTGSTDGTVALAESFGARVHHFPWSDDFSAARNHSIACARSDYLLWLDADDRIAPEDAKSLLKLKEVLRPQKDRAYMMRILGCSQDMPQTVSYQTRIVPNRLGVRFEGRVHEQILPSLTLNGIPVEETGITIRHTGYHNPEQRRAKAQRNLAILKQELAEGKDTATQCFFIAMAAMGIGDYDQCLEYIEKARKKRKNEDWLHYSHVIAGECLTRLGRMQDAVEEFRRGIVLFSTSRLLHYYLGTTYAAMGRDEDAIPVLEKVMSLPERIDTYPVPPDLGAFAAVQLSKALERTGNRDKAIEICRDALKKAKAPRMLHHELGILLAGAGKAQEALFHLEQAKRLSEGVDVSLWLTLAAVYRHMGVYDEAKNLYAQIMRDAEPGNLKALEGALSLSVELDDIDTFFDALERFLVALDIPVPEETVESLEACSRLCLSIAAGLKERTDLGLAEKVAQTALRLDEACWGAHLVLAECRAEKQDQAGFVESVEKALKAGADRKAVLALLTRYQPH